MIMGQDQTGTSVPGVPGSAPPQPAIYKDPSSASRDSQERLKRLRSWQTQNTPATAAAFAPSQVMRPAMTALRPTAVAAPPPARPALPFNAANPRVY